MSARHFEIIKRPELVVPEAALRRRHICYSGSPPPVLVFRGSNSVSNDDGSHTHSGLSFGTASSDRALIATVSTNVADDATVSVTIGGVSAMRIAKINIDGFSAEIWIASVPSGTSGSVVLSGPGGSINWSSCVGIYSVTGLRSLAASDTDTDSILGPGTLSTTVSVPSFGIVISVATEQQIADSATWTGASQNYFRADSNSGTAASFSATSARSLTVTTKFNGTTQRRAGATASFR